MGVRLAVVTLALGAIGLQVGGQRILDLGGHLVHSGAVCVGEKSCFCEERSVGSRGGNVVGLQ